jgi:hypothetical protein
MPNPPDVAQGSTSTHQGDEPKDRPGYWLAFFGAVVGYVVMSALFLVFVVIGGMGGVWDPSMGVISYGQFAAALVGLGVGITGALALAKKEAAVLTGLLSIPVMVAARAVVAGVFQIIDTLDFGWLLTIPLLLVPFVSRWAALAIRRGR